MNTSPRKIQTDAVEIPLCCDLDGTLVRTDLFHESILWLAKYRTMSLLLLPFWLVKGKTFAKMQVAKRAFINVRILPFRSEVLEFLTQERNTGRKIVLTTAADSILANKIAVHLGIFDEVIASQGTLNLKGKNKSAILVERFGVGHFDYIGDSKCDLPVWKSSNLAFVVGGGYRLVESVSKIGNLSQKFLPTPKSVRSIIHSLRAHQWVKNILLFLPLIVSHQIFHWDALLKTFYGFFSFCLCSSSVYILNDLLDLESDRVHPRKMKRPFASGELSIFFGLSLAVILMSLAFSIALFLNFGFFECLSLYFLLTLSYSLYLKRTVLFDVVVLSLLYTMRILSGHEVSNVAYSPWLFAFSMFTFFSLALVKRYSELHNLSKREIHFSSGRGYRATDRDLLASMGASSSYLSVLVIALYLNSPSVLLLYSRPAYLWILCPIILYWFSRIWLITHRGWMDEDPIVFALKDKISYYILTLCALVIILAGY